MGDFLHALGQDGLKEDERQGGRQHDGHQPGADQSPGDGAHRVGLDAQEGSPEIVAKFAFFVQWREREDESIMPWKEKGFMTYLSCI